MTRNIAVVGGGAAGLAAAYRLHPHCSVTVFERDQRFGGHAWTMNVPDGPDAGLPLDLAFMVLNEQRYPILFALISELNVKLARSEMSFSYCCRESGEEYAINHDRSRDGSERDTARATPIASPLTSMLGEVVRFGLDAVRDLSSGRMGDISLSDYLDERRISADLRQKYIVPMGAALWSAPPGKILNYPAERYLSFLHNHGLLAFDNALAWRHVAGGSRTYVEALLHRLSGANLRPDTAVTRIRRTEALVAISTQNQAEESFDGVIIATHADQALALLADASPEEKQLIGAFSYQVNEATLHWDDSVMPRELDAWASWNYERETRIDAERVCVTYLLNRLQGHSKAKNNYFLTLNRTAPIDERKIIFRTSFSHPVFDARALRAQRTLVTRNLQARTAFAGSYLGYGFHEDAIASGVAAADAMLDS